MILFQRDTYLHISSHLSRYYCDCRGDDGSCLHTQLFAEYREQIDQLCQKTCLEAPSVNETIPAVCIGLRSLPATVLLIYSVARNDGTLYNSGKRAVVKLKRKGVWTCSMKSTACRDYNPTSTSSPCSHISSAISAASVAELIDATTSQPVDFESEDDAESDIEATAARTGSSNSIDHCVSHQPISIPRYLRPRQAAEDVAPAWSRSREAMGVLELCLDGGAQCVMGHEADTAQLSQWEDAVLYTQTQGSGQSRTTMSNKLTCNPC